MRTFILAFALITFFSSCRFLGGERVRGNGNIISASRNVGNFNSIEAEGAVQVRLKQDGSSSVKVETDENLLEFLEVNTNGSTLVIRPRQGFNLDPSEEIIVYVSAPEFESLEASGASKIIGEGVISGELELGASGASEINMEVNAPELRADLSGASTLQLRGSSARFSLEASGASNIKCLDLNTDKSRLELSGASEAKITANKQLEIEASGASNVEYRGNANINQKSSGASSVRKIS